MGLHIFFIILYIAVSYLLPVDSLVSVLLLLHCAINLINDISKKKPLYVMTTFNIGVMIATVANILFVIRVKTTGLGEHSMYHYIAPQYIEDATLIWAIGNAAIFAGYHFFQNNTLPPITLNLANKVVVKNLFFFILIFTILNILGKVRYDFLGGGFEKAMNLLAVIGILFYARLWTKENNDTYRNYALILFGLETIVAMGSYLRSDLITPFFTLFCGYFLGKEKLRYLFSYRMIPLVLFIVIFSQFFDSLGGHRSNFIAAFTEGAKTDNKAYVFEDENAEREGVLVRSSNVTQLTNIVRLTRNNGFYEGAASAPLITALVPRFLWPDKPQIQLGAWFAVEIGVATIGDFGKANNSINMTIPGQLFLDFGWIGLILGCFLFGGFLALLWNAAHFYDSPYNLTGTLWGGFMLLSAFGGMGADLQIVISLTSTYLAFLIIKRFVKQHNETNTVDRAAVAGK